MDHRDRRLAAVAAEQYSTFTMDQAMASGFARTTVHNRVERGLYARVHRDVFAVAGSAPSWNRDVIAAVLSISHLAAASHQTAAYLWSMTSRKGKSIEAITTRWDRVHREFVIHESKDLIAADVHTMNGIPVTSPPRTIVDLCASAPRWLAASCFDTALRKQILDVGDVDRFVGRVAKPGRTGVRLARELVQERLRWDSVTESELEDRFRHVVERSGLPLPEPQYVLRDLNGEFVCRADFAYPERRVLIELDSEAFHMDRESFRGDRRKQNRALALGWHTLRFTWHDLTTDPGGVLSTLAYARPK